MQAPPKEKKTIAIRTRGPDSNVQAALGSRSVLGQIRLPPPLLDAGLSLTRALQRRRTTREIADRKLPRQVLSNLLWAGCGINRKHGPFGLAGRTAASASNSQEIDVYLALEEATYLYEPRPHTLRPIASGDLRRLAIGPGQSGAGANAPLRIIYVADIARLANTAGFQEPGLHDPDVQRSYYYVDTGLIAGNVYLFAAALGLAAWFHNCNRPLLSKALGLRTEQRVLFAQTVGYPDKKGRSST